MRKWIILLASLMLAACRSEATQPPGKAPETRPVAAADDWKLVWSDEFNQDGPPDPRNWVFENGFVRNEELQWYQPDNARCENGLLVIEARRERKQNPRYNPNGRSWRSKREYAQYTSACLTTRGLHEFQFGRIEMKARINTDKGIWPAFWTVGSTGRWPSAGEIDIMEFYGGNLLANVAWGLEGKPADGLGHQEGAAWWDDMRKPVGSFRDLDWSKKFHVWRMDWDKSDIRIYVDGVLLKHTELTETVDAAGQTPFRKPQFLLLDLAIGGFHGGDPADTKFPVRYEVDYIRVYQETQPDRPAAESAK